MPDGRLIPPFNHDRPEKIVEDGQAGADQTIRLTARQWASPSVKEQRTPFIPLLQKGHAFDFQPCMAGTAPRPLDLGLFLNRLKSHPFSISCMAFQDVWNVDLERIRDCCIHIFSSDGRLIPFCMYNLTDAGGQSLYRSSHVTS